MIESLRKKFILICMCSVFSVLFVIAAFVNGFNYVNVVNRANEILNILAENNGEFPRPQKHDKTLKPKDNGLTKEAPFSTRYFYVRIDTKDNISSVNTGEIFSVTSAEATSYAQKALLSGKDTGFILDYKYRVVENSQGRLLVFLDCERELGMFKEYLITTMLISVAALFGVFILVLIFSKKAVKPIAESYEKQKRFITDAGHELKTPITIINANVEVLELEQSENEWTKSIKGQTYRLAELVNALVSLARMEETQTSLIKTDFPISDVAAESAEEFQILAKKHGKIINAEIEKNISAFGSEDLVRELINILLDNAVKYAQSEQVSFCVKKQGKKCVINTTNVANGIIKGDNAVLFDRFYRADKSRGETKGNGVGLSIAKSIVQKHKGKIKAYSKDGSILEIEIIL